MGGGTNVSWSVVLFEESGVGKEMGGDYALKG